ncbi:MAG: phosphotransferase [Chloroflexi bacterium]|nr:phosphotransferase [Chloroflexota bacterium]MCI0579552.1 phosphotransferase [Chloroflexota bacterium]MCI0647271.1 phosphotransferase [Chloroflexota bacterium]MCI0729310.1 phosphotransferase [Chloroflexota bacterium]
MVRVNELQNLDPAAWTALLVRELDAPDIVVTEVAEERLGNGRHLTRYLLSLAGYAELTTLVGKQTNAAEAQFYQELAGSLAFLVPRCWFSHVAGDQSWVLLDEVHNDWPADSWTEGDVEEIVGDMAALHAVFWGQEEELAQLGWRSPFASQPAPAAAFNSRGAARRNGAHRPAPRFERGRRPLISDHAIRSAGRLAPQLIKAAAGLEMIRAVGGWPGVIKEKHLAAVADLIDDPLPMLYPLRLLPATLLHGDLSIDHWHITLFNERRLLDWQKATCGPAVADLVNFIEQFDLLESEAGGWRGRCRWPATEETMIDGYMLAMHRALGERFNATATRRAIPSARCLYVLTTWLTRFADWFQHLPASQHTWQTLNKMDDDELAEAGFSQIVGLRPYLAGVFERFWTAYKAL